MPLVFVSIETCFCFLGQFLIINKHLRISPATCGFWRQRLLDRLSDLHTVDQVPLLQPAGSVLRPASAPRPVAGFSQFFSPW